ncbi:MAG TPA: hypothetical protein VJL54_07220 [Nitrososphaera sp.]|jgi:hypothetical protein|nr:hypothetical protein [Nitrososphaera sp.]
MFAADSASERATSIEDYQNACREFITDISKDYMDWVDRYQLGEAEASARKSAIREIVRQTNEWISRYGNAIKKVDIIMNDGVNKMAENTAGYPFGYNVLVNSKSRFTDHPVGQVRLNVRASPRAGRIARIGNYQRDQLLLLSSSAPVEYSVSKESLHGGDILDDFIVIDAKGCARHDLISVTAVVEEVEGDHVVESRGYSTLILLT